MIRSMRDFVASVQFVERAADDAVGPADELRMEVVEAGREAPRQQRLSGPAVDQLVPPSVERA